LQGLLNLYEKDDTRKIENKRQKQCDVLERLVALHGADEDKRVEVENKLIDLLPSIGRANRAAEILHARVRALGEDRAAVVLAFVRICSLLREHEASLFPAKVVSILFLLSSHTHRRTRSR
jgi:hypothetical protein